MILRDYQIRAVDDTIAVLHKNPVLVAPTGSGKTVMATALVERLAVPTIWMAHRKELIEQAAHRLEAHGLTTGIVMAGFPPFPLAQVQVASVQTLVRRDKPNAEIIIIDECHHAAAGTYREIIEAYPGVPIVGLTATPFRLDGKGLGDMFGELVIAASTNELCDSGVLHRPKVWASKSPDLRGIKITAGDYNLKSLAEKTNTDDLNADIIETWQKHAAGKRTVAFAVNIEHSIAIADAFQAAGVPAEHLDGTTGRDQRGEILRRLRTGETLVVSNCMVLTEGWDLPALECAIIARPTASLNLHLQMIGRIMRSADGKAGAIVLDHAGNHHVHGLVTRHLDYSLDHGKKVGFSEPLGLRRCRNCGLFFEPTKFQCPECGWIPSAEESRRDTPDVHGAGELTEFDDAAHEYRQTVWNSIEAERQASMYQPGWSAYRFKERFGVWPVIASGELVDPQNATMEQKEEVYIQFLEAANQKGFKPGWASYRYKEAFGVWPKGFVSEVRRNQMTERWDEQRDLQPVR